ncbi:MAG: winged helix-turn-helix transcriptional regulator [Acidimicrobiales bacterium]
MAKRAYGHYCALARALDLVGERWTLLIIRELVAGGRRFGQLLGGLPGISSNLLTERLRSLEDTGVIAHVEDVYSLTELGAGLVPTLRALAGWGRQFLEAPTPGVVFQPRWLLASLEGVFRPERSVGARQVCELRTGGESFHLVVDNGSLETHEGPAQDPDLVVSADVWVLLGLGMRMLDPVLALQEGKVRVLGSWQAFLQCLSFFDARPLGSEASQIAPGFVSQS